MREEGCNTRWQIKKVEREEGREKGKGKGEKKEEKVRGGKRKEIKDKG